MTSMQRKQGRKAIHSWKGAGRLFEQWREDLRTLTVELKQPRPQKPTPSEGIRGKDVLFPFSLPGPSCCPSESVAEPEIPFVFVVESSDKGPGGQLAQNRPFRSSKRSWTVDGQSVS